MSRILASIFIAVLAACVVFSLALRTGRSGFAVTALIAIAMLMTLALWRRMPGGLRVPVLIVSSILIFVSVIGALVGIGTTLSDRFDEPKNLPPLVIGKDSPAGKIAIVYHPGGSGFTRRIVTNLGEDLAARGYTVTVLTAYPDIAFDLTGCRALVIASPVYGGQIRPPLQEFIHAHPAFSIPVFVVFTGWFGAMKDEDLHRLYDATARDGLKIRDAVKVAWGDSRGTREGRLTAFARVIDESL